MNINHDIIIKNNITRDVIFLTKKYKITKNMSKQI